MRRHLRRHRQRRILGVEQEEQRALVGEGEVASPAPLSPGHHRRLGVGVAVARTRDEWAANLRHGFVDRLPLSRDLGLVVGVAFNQIADEITKSGLSQLSWDHRLIEYARPGEARIVADDHEAQRSRPGL